MIDISYTNQYRNYCLFDEERVSARAEKRENELEKIQKSLENPKDEAEVLEDLYILNRMIDDGVKGVDKLYPALSKYNDTKSPNIQTFLAGIYRKIKIPDAFGPLWTMLIQNSINPPKNCPFDPNEEIGGAILDYLA